MRTTGKLNGGFLLKRFDEFDQVTFVCGAYREEMHVVRHDAIRVDKKRAKRGVFSQAGDEPRGKAWICAEAATIMEAERDKIRIATTIMIGVEPEAFAPEVSGRGHNRATQDAELKAAALRLNLRIPSRKDAALRPRLYV